MASIEDRDFITQHNIHFDSDQYHEKLLYSYVNDDRLPGKLKDMLAANSFSKTTPIQAISLPWIMSGKDFIGISKTGSGKTLGFMIPAFIRILNSNYSHSNSYPKVLVVAPTRELALQTHNVVEKFNSRWSVCVYGGASRGEQSRALRSKRPPIIIGTPGRINDFLEFGTFHLNNTDYLVFDEADRMFDMGFHPQIMKIVDKCPSKNERQTLLFSATWTKKVQELANPLLKHDRIVTSVGEFKLSACEDIKQHLFLCSEFEKKKLLAKILNEFKGYKILVFINTKNHTQQLANDCVDRGLCESNDFIHGDCSQERREEIIKRFNRGRSKVIFATDVASRGLDINDIHVVINYDFPMDVETYVHRIGRTGRNGKKGLAFTFITDRTVENSHLLSKLIRVVKESNNIVPDNILNAGSFY